jgi:hypothetical protein
VTYPQRMPRALSLAAIVAITSALVAASFGAKTVYDGRATRAAARADHRAHITAPPASDTPLGSPTTRFAFRLRRNSGGVAVYRTHTAAVTALAQGEALARAFGQTLKGFAAVHANVIIGFANRPTAADRTETEGWLRSG